MMAVPGRTTDDRIPKHRCPIPAGERRTAFPHRWAICRDHAKRILKGRPESDGTLQLLQNLVEAPVLRRPRLHEAGVPVTVGRAGRLSVHTLDERAHGMRETGYPSSVRRDYRPRRVAA